MMWHRSTRTTKHNSVTAKAKDEGSLWKKDAVKPAQRWRNVDVLLAASLLIIWLISSVIDKSHAHTQGIRGLQYIFDGDDTTSENTNINERHDDVSKTNNDDYVLWSRNQTYFGDCQNNIVGNDEWGEERAPYVDKVGVKDMIQKWEEENDDELKSLNLKIPQTLAVFTRANASLFTLEALEQIPQPYVIKTSHGSGVVARVHNNTYLCLKGNCRGKMGWNQHRILDKKSFEFIHRVHIKKQLLGDIRYIANNKEPQYQYVPPSIIVEEDILMDNEDITKDVTYWYTSNGIPLFVSQQCLPNKNGRPGTLYGSRKFYSSRYNMLSMKLAKDICPDSVPKPDTWDRQRRIVESLGKHLPKGTVRVDLYAGQDDIYFSEFTFTTSKCDAKFTPAVADGLLYAVSHEEISQREAKRPEYVESLLNGMGSWGMIKLNKQKEVRGMLNYPSPLDLCESYASVEDPKKFKGCIRKSRKVSKYPMRCMIHDGNDHLDSFGLHRKPTVQRVAGKFIWERIFAMALVLGYMFTYKVGTSKVTRSRIIMSNVVIAVIAVASDVILRQNGTWFSHLGTIGIIKESFNTFYLVHPVQNVSVCMSHFLTYWIHAAQWFVTTPRKVLIYALVTEVVVQFVNEWTHHNEWRTDVRCSRVSFINGMTVTVYDEIWREFVLGPFFVYFSLLPRFILHWTKVLLGIGGD